MRKRMLKILKAGLVMAAALAVAGCGSGNNGSGNKGSENPAPSPTASVITWATPAAVPVGTVLSATQLDATASVAGTFVYSPEAGTVLTTAGNTTLKTTFTPTDTVDYSTASASVTLTVSASGKIFEPGDSLVAGGQDGDYLDTTPYFLQLLSGEIAYNLGLPGTTSTQIAIGIGAESANAVGSVTIPACSDASSCGGVEVSFSPGQNPNVQGQVDGVYNHYQAKLPGSLGGVSGILTCPVDCRGGSGFNFTPHMLTSGGTFTNPTWQTNLSDAGINTATCVIEGGYNNIGFTDTVEADITAMMAMPCSKSGALQGIPYANTPNQWIGGGTIRSAIDTLNAWEAATYPTQAIDIDGMFVSSVCPLASTQADPESVIDCGHGVTPALFRAQDTAGAITADIDSSTCDIPVTGLSGQGSPNFGLGMTMTIGAEKIYINAFSEGSVTACTRGYASTTPASYKAGEAFTAVDSLHLNGAGYKYIAQWDWAVIQALRQ